jgi:hypothetical protein
MFPLILLGLAGVTGLYLVADFMGAFGDVSQTANDSIEDAELEEKLPLLEDGALDALETALRSDPILSDAPPPESRFSLAEYDLEAGTSITTEGDDFAVIPEDVTDGMDMVDGRGGSDVVIGNSADNALFGDTGDDTLLAGGGFDQVFGEDGNDILAGQDGGDLLVGGKGSDIIYGGAGDDNIFDSAYLTGYVGQSDADVISAGDGNDGLLIEDGVNLISLGSGADHVMVYTQSGGTPGAVITDFDPNEDGLLLGVHAPDLALENGANTLALNYRLSEIETPLGMGTLVEPAVTSQSLADSLAGANVSYAVLLGLSPEDLASAAIQVYLTAENSEYFGEDSIHTLAKQMGATRL